MSIKDSGFIQENSINMCISKALLKPCFVAYGKNGQAKFAPTGGAAGRRLLFPALGIKRGRGTVCHALFLSAVRLRTAHTASAPSPADCVSRPTALRSVCSAPGLVPQWPVLRPSLSFPAASPGLPFVPHTPACPEGRTYCSYRPPPPVGRRG